MGWLSAASKHDKLCLLLGEMTIHFGFIEFQIHQIACRLVDRENFKKGEIFFDKMDSLNTKIGYIKNLAEFQIKPEPRERLIKILNTISNLAATRNRYIHDMWLAGKEEIVRHQSVKTNGKFIMEDTKIEDIEKLVNNTELATQELAYAFFFVIDENAWIGRDSSRTHEEPRNQG